MSLILIAVILFIYSIYSYASARDWEESQRSARKRHQELMEIERERLRLEKERHKKTSGKRKPQNTRRTLTYGEKRSNGDLFFKQMEYEVSDDEELDDEFDEEYGTHKTYYNGAPDDYDDEDYDEDGDYRKRY